MNSRKIKKKSLYQKDEKGGAAIEYIIVSTFATMLAVGAVTFVSQVLKGKISSIEEKLGINFSEDFNVFR